MKTSGECGTALITGASSGIGKELALIHASNGGGLVLAARREQALQDLKSEIDSRYSVPVELIVVDLSTETGPRELYETVKKRGLEIEILVNNAGVGGHGAFFERDLDSNLKMVDLNVKALMTLTNLFLQDMNAAGTGKILNVGSTAGMVPGPLNATYHATKAFVNSFSQAIADEMRHSGTTVTVLAPGTVETEFFKTADMADVRGTQEKMATAESVARIGYDAMMRGDLFVVNDWKLNLLLRYVIPFVPRRTVLRRARRFAEKKTV